MAQTPEGLVKQKIRKILVQHDVFYFLPVSNGMGKIGISDFICCLPNGKFLAIEAKAGKGVATELQKQFLLAVQCHKGYALIVNENTLDELETLIKGAISNEVI